MTDDGGPGVAAPDRSVAGAYRSSARGAPSGRPAPLAETDRLTKRFGATIALDEVSLLVPPGRVLGVVGPPGAGKTTLLRHLVGLLLPTSGHVWTLGAVARDGSPEHLSEVGYLDAETRPPAWLRVEGFLEIVADQHLRWDPGLVADLLLELGVEPRVRVGRLTRAERQAVSLAAVVGHEPALLILDDPLGAASPGARGFLGRFLRTVVADGARSAVVGTDLRDDLAPALDDVAMLHRGRLTVQGDLRALEERWATDDGKPASLHTIYEGELGAWESRS